MITDPFMHQIQQHISGSWPIFGVTEHLDARVVRPVVSSTEEDALYIQFVDESFHRRLLHCFVGGSGRPVWGLEDLLRKTRPPSLLALQDALRQCLQWQLVVKDEVSQTWQGHPRLERVGNLGWTFEWAVQKVLEREYGALVRRHVMLGGLGEIDVLAVLDGRWLLMECKSSSKGVTNGQVDRFLAKWRAFQADWSVLLIDTDDSYQMKQRLGQLRQAMGRVVGKASVGAIEQVGGTSLVRVRDSLMVANTGHAISETLRAIVAR